MYSDTIVLDTAPPAVTVEIAAGAYAVNTTTVTATVAGSDASSGMDTLEWSDDGSTWTDTVPFAAGDYTRTLQEPSLYDGPDFGPQVTYGVGDGPRSVAVGDLDGDGDLDLVVANVFDNNVSVLLNQGDGTFAGEATYDASSEYTLDIATSDDGGDSGGQAMTVTRTIGGLASVASKPLPAHPLVATTPGQAETPDAGPQPYVCLPLVLCYP